MNFSLVLPEPPSANRWWRRAGKKIHLSPEARSYKALVWAKAVSGSGKTQSQLPLYPTGDVRVTLLWTRGRKSGDLDKRIGVVLDALQGVVYANDKQIVSIRAERRDAKNDSSLIVTVEAL